MNVLSILFSVVESIPESCLSPKISVGEFSLLSNKKINKLRVYMAMISRAKDAIAVLKGRLRKEKHQLLTGVTATLDVPQDERNLHFASIHLLGVNSKSKHMARALENCKAYNRFLKLSGDIEPREMVIYRDGYGKSVRQDSDSIVICLEPWTAKKVYVSTMNKDGIMQPHHQKARMARWEPSLNKYKREEWLDTVPTEREDVVHFFYMDHNHISPNVNGPAKRTHP